MSDEWYTGELMDDEYDVERPVFTWESDEVVEMGDESGGGDIGM